MSKHTTTFDQRFREVDYDDARHKYFLGNIIYRSATQIIEQFYEHFDTPEKSVYMSERYGNTPEYWVAKWKEGNQESLSRGTTLHNEKEEFTYGRGFDRLNGKDFIVRNRNLWPNHFPYNKLPDGCYPELKLWRHDFRIAGRADKPTFETISNSRYMHIEDYKTNKKIEKESFKDKEGNYRMMIGPLSHLMDCNYNHYTLQLSLYQYMGEYMGFKPGIRRIIHYPHTIFPHLPPPKPVVYQLEYMKKEVIAMLHHLKYKQWLN